MLPKSERLTKEDFSKGRPKVFFRGSLFDIAVLPSPTTKFACVISKKTLPRAVDRNKVKRRLFSCVSKVSTEKQGLFILYPKKVTLSSTFQELSFEIKNAFDTLQ